MLPQLIAGGLSPDDIGPEEEYAIRYRREPRSANSSPIIIRRVRRSLHLHLMQTTLKRDTRVYPLGDGPMTPAKAIEIFKGLSAEQATPEVVC